MKRSEILEAARRCVCGEREQDYGTPENNFETIGLLWGVYLRAAHPEYAKVMPINGNTAKDAGTMLALLKVARIATGSSPGQPVLVVEDWQPNEYAGRCRRGTKR